MRVVFLDFDGVLNSWRYFKDAHDAGTILDMPQHQIDKKAVRWLNEIVEPTGAKVVISSTWRVLHSLEELRLWLSEKGFRGEVIDKTPDLSWRRVGPDQSHAAARMAIAERGHEIDAWLREHPEVTAFVILDDGSDMAMHVGRLVQTTVAKGLKPKHVIDAIALLASSSERTEGAP